MPQVQLEQKTRTHVSQVIGLALVVGFGALAAAGLWFMDYNANTVTPTKAVKRVAYEPPGDLTNATVPAGEVSATTAEFKAALAAVPAPGVTVAIQSPTEGAIVNGATPVTVTMSDTTGQVNAVRVLVFGPHLNGVSLGNDTAAPYTFVPNYAMYPSGEYRYVAQAVRIVANAEPQVLASADTMVTWNRACYWLGYHDMTLTSPTSAVRAGSSFTVTGSVKNYHRGNCQFVYGARTTDAVTLANLLPNGWTATFTPATFPVAINETKTFSMTVQIPATTTAGTYSVGANTFLQSTGFNVTKKVDVNVLAAQGGGGGSGGGRDILETQ